MTQQHLLQIAIREFGSKGLEGASTRGIAAAAGTAMSSITYHYNGKEGLYLAAAEHIAEQMTQEMVPALAAEAGISEDDPREARAAVHRLIGRLLEKMASDDTADWALFILREQLNPSDAFERIWGGVMGQVSHRLADLVCVATGAPAKAARLATVTLLGQALGVRAFRAAMLRLLDVDGLTPPLLREFKARIDANIDAILDRMVAEEQQ